MHFSLKKWTLFPPAPGWMIFNILPIINKASDGTQTIYVLVHPKSIFEALLLFISVKPFFLVHSQNLHIVLFNTPLCCLLLALYSHGGIEKINK